MRDLVLAAVLVLVVACGEDPSPTLLSTEPVANRVPVILSFDPPLDSVDVDVGQEVAFSVVAEDPDGDTLDIAYLVDGTNVASGPDWALTPAAERELLVRAVVTDGEATAERRWWVRASQPAPTAVRLLGIEALPAPGEASVRWLPGTDYHRRPLARYEVRALSRPIENDADWDAASLFHSVLTPTAPVLLFSARLFGLSPGTWYVTVRGFDEGGRASVLVRAVPVRIVNRRVEVTVVDAVTRLPLGGIEVCVGETCGESDALGRFVIDAFPNDRFQLLVRDGGLDGTGGYYDYRGDYAVGQVMVPLIPDVPVASESYPDFTTMYQHLTTIRGIPDGERTRRWELPLKVYVPAFTSAGLDYRAAILEVMEGLEVEFRRDLFTLVDRAPSVGLRIMYKSNIYADRYVFESFTPDYFPERSHIEFRTHYEARHLTVFQTVVRHEFGHALGLINHSPDPRHLMVGGSAPTATDFTPDERRVLGSFLSLPRGSDPLPYIQE